MDTPGVSRLPARPVVWVALGYWSEPIFLGIAQYAAANGWILDTSMCWQRGPVRAPARKPDGVIVYTGTVPGLAAIVKELGVPVVDIENYNDHYGAPKVVGDDIAVGEIAARHLAANRPDRLLFVRRPKSTDETTRLRAKGFFDEAKRAGIPAVEADFDTFAPERWSASGRCGVFCQGDPLALTLLDRCLEAGVTVPDDLELLGADDTGYICTLARVPLSSVNMDFERKGLAAGALLDRLMRGEKTGPKPVVVPPAGVTRRESTRSIRTGDDDTDRFVRHLRENSRRHVRVETLCEEFGIPPRTAQHRLKAKLGVSPSDLLTRFRLENAESLAALGTLKADAVAKASGFGGAAALRRARKAAVSAGP